MRSLRCKVLHIEGVNTAMSATESSFCNHFSSPSISYSPYLRPTVPFVPAGTRTLVGRLCDLINTSCITKLTFLEQDRDKDGETTAAFAAC